MDTTTVNQGYTFTQRWQRVANRTLPESIFFHTDYPKRDGKLPKGKNLPDSVRTGLTDAARATLDRYASYLNSSRTDSVALTGWADTTFHGPRSLKADYNRKLSQRRVDTGFAYLKAHGVNPAIIRSTTGEGETAGFAVRQDSAGLQQNRRVALRAVGPDSVLVRDSVLGPRVCSPRQ